MATLETVLKQTKGAGFFAGLQPSAQSHGSSHPNFAGSAVGVKHRCPAIFVAEKFLYVWTSYPSSRRDVAKTIWNMEERVQRPIASAAGVKVDTAWRLRGSPASGTMGCQGLPCLRQK